MEPARPQPWLAVLSSLDYPLPIFVSPIIAVGYLHQALHSNMFCRIFYPVSDAATDLQVLVSQKPVVHTKPREKKIPKTALYLFNEMNSQLAMPVCNRNEFLKNLNNPNFCMRKKKLK